MLIRYCSNTCQGLRYQGGDLPTTCASCERTVWEWFTFDELGKELKPYVVTSNDARFLRSIRVDPEVPVAGTVKR